MTEQDRNDGLNLCWVISRIAPRSRQGGLSCSAEVAWSHICMSSRDKQKENLRETQIYQLRREKCVGRVSCSYCWLCAVSPSLQRLMSSEKRFWLHLKSWSTAGRREISTACSPCTLTMPKNSTLPLSLWERLIFACISKVRISIYIIVIHCVDQKCLWRPEFFGANTHRAVTSKLLSFHNFSRRRAMWWVKPSHHTWIFLLVFILSRHSILRGFFLPSCREHQSWYWHECWF